MIQRIQTIYLFLSVIATGLLFFIPNWIPGIPAIDNMSPYMLYFLVGFVIVMLFTQFATIFLYKNRKRQLMFGRINIALNMVFVIACFFLNLGQKDSFNILSIHTLKIGMLLPFISIILIILANRNIRKDEELIRSMNRLR